MPKGINVWKNIASVKYSPIIKNILNLNFWDPPPIQISENASILALIAPVSNYSNDAGNAPMEKVVQYFPTSFQVWWFLVCVGQTACWRK